MFSSIYFIGSPSQLSFLLTDLLFSTFNPADYTANSGTRQETWEGDGNEPAEGTGKEIANLCYGLAYFNCLNSI